MRMSKKKLLNSYTTPVSPSHQAYLNDYFNRIRFIRIIQLAIIISFLLFWEIASRIGLLDAFIFSSPYRVMRIFISMASDGSIFYHIGITLLETFISFSLVNILGVGIAILLWWNNNLAKILEPYLVVLNSLPKSALAPVFIVWLGNNMKTIIVASVSVAVFGTIITLYTDFINVEADKIKLIQTLRGRKKDILLKVVLPSNIPSLISIMKVNIGLSLVGVIIGEFLAAKAGLGYLIIYGSQVFKLDLVIMSIVILCILATILYQLLAYFDRKIN
ncbi:MAG: binding-protein-dependent transport system inner rane component [Anaerocolumna sp.]|nr:binding-protein-dependent transport system inner rane component [Anaerocolumna sp.]